MELTKLLQAKIKEAGSAAAAAEKAGVAYPSFVAAAKGKSVPNARTFKKYAKFLGIGIDELQKLTAAAKGTKPRAGRGARRGPGRPPGKRGPGRPPGKRGPGRPPGRSGGLAASLTQAARVVADAEAVLADRLAVAVHALGAAQRRIVESLIAGLR